MLDIILKVICSIYMFECNLSCVNLRTYIFCCASALYNVLPYSVSVLATGPLLYTVLLGNIALRKFTFYMGNKVLIGGIFFAYNLLPYMFWQTYFCLIDA